MLWFMLGCLLGGAAVGFLFRTPIVLAVTSFQIVVCLAGIWMSGGLTLDELVLFSLSGLFVHQSAYLAALVGRAVLEEARPPSLESIASKFENDLLSLDRLARTIAMTAPSASREAAKLSRLVGELRDTLRDEQHLERLLRDLRSSAH